MAIADTDIEYRLSGGVSNTDPNASIGGAISTLSGGLIVSGNPENLFDATSGDEAAAGDVEYRCFFIKNKHATLTWISPKVWVKTASSSADVAFALGLASEGVGGTPSAIANESTAPSGVTFTTPTTKAGGLSVADVPAGSSVGVWVRRTVTAGAAAADVTVTVRAEGDSNP